MTTADTKKTQKWQGINKHPQDNAHGPERTRIMELFQLEKTSKTNQNSLMPPKEITENKR